MRTPAYRGSSDYGYRPIYRGFSDDEEFLSVGMWRQITIWSRRMDSCPDLAEDVRTSKSGKKWIIWYARYGKQRMKIFQSDDRLHVFLSPIVKGYVYYENLKSHLLRL